MPSNGKGKSVKRRTAKTSVMPKIDAALCERVRTYASIGAGYREIGWTLGVHPETFYYHLARNDDLQAAYQKGRNEGIIFVMSKLRELIAKDDKAAIFFYLKTQAGWRDSAPVEVGVSVGVTVGSPAEQLKELYDEWKAEEKRTGSSSGSRPTPKLPPS